MVPFSSPEARMQHPPHLHKANSAFYLTEMQSESTEKEGEKKFP